MGNIMVKHTDVVFHGGDTILNDLICGECGSLKKINNLVFSLTFFNWTKLILTFNAFNGTEK